MNLSLDCLGIYAAQFSPLARAMLSRALMLQIDIVHLLASFDDMIKVDQIRAGLQATRQQNLTSMVANHSD